MDQFNAHAQRSDRPNVERWKGIPSAVKVVDMERRSDYITEKTSATLSGQQRLVHSYQWESY